MNWDQYFMSLAYFVAMKSKDPSTRVGTVVVGPDMEIRSTGYNGLPRGVGDAALRAETGDKYFWTEHSERNSLYNAVRMGISLKGCILYTQGTPCADCARGIIQSGISEVVVHALWEDTDQRPKWKESMEFSLAMFAEAGVIRRKYDGPLMSRIIGFRGGTEISLA